MAYFEYVEAGRSEGSNAEENLSGLAFRLTKLEFNSMNEF